MVLQDEGIQNTTTLTESWICLCVLERECSPSVVWQVRLCGALGDDVILQDGGYEEFAVVRGCTG